MRYDTGEIRYLEDGEMPSDMEIAIDPEDMTEKQKKNMRVSLHDNRSKLGKLLQQQRKLTKNERKRARRARKGK